MSRYLLFLIPFFLVFFLSFAQTDKKLLYKGNLAYENKDFSKASSIYRKGLEENQKSYEFNYNAGNASYRTKNYQQSKEFFNNALSSTNDDLKKSKSYYNLGNVLMQEKNYHEAMRAYKEALKFNPEDDEARYNYRIAKQKLEEQRKKQNQQQQDKKDKSNEKESEKERKENQQQDNQGQQPPDNLKNNKADIDPSKNGSKPEQNQQMPKDPKAFEDILNAVEMQEKKARQKIVNRKMEQREPESNGKNW